MRWRFPSLCRESLKPVGFGPVTLNAQKCRELFQAVEKSGLNPRECEFKNLIADSWTHITHIQSGDCLSIRISRSGVTPATKYWLARNRSAFMLAFKSGNASFVDLDWATILAKVEDWASQVSTTRNIWKEFIADQEIPAASHDNTENAPFAASEREEVRERLHQIPAQVRERFSLSAKQESAIEQKLDNLIEATERVGKKDWLVMVYGSAFGLIVNDEIPPHVVQTIITMIVTGIAHAFGIGGLPPFLPPHA
jgi:hypothetical protein